VVDGCPDEADVLEFVEGRLASADTERMRTHVDGCAACRELVASLADVCLETAGDPAEGHGAPEHLLRGALIGRYTVLAREGAGGMGAVHSAYDPELDRKVALKLVRTDLLARGNPDELRARMAREAKAMARIRHPNVVAIYDVGTIGDELFIAMEFVEGTTLGVWTRAHPRTWREILAQYLQAGEGLAAAHRAGLVHRDFKPDNVLVGSDGRVCVGDFGLVRLHATAGETAPAVPVGHPDRLSTATFVGTPAYMAPEQRAGQHVDARADQFSFCRALEEALFEDERAAAPAWLRAPLERGQRARPDERWPSMTELLHALRRDPVRTRRRGIVGLGTAILTCAAVIVVWRFSGATGPVCPEPMEALVGVWDETVRERMRAAFADSDRADALTTHARVDDALAAYAASWAEMRRDACEATHVRAEQSDQLFDLRMGCLVRARSTLAALTELLVDPSTIDVDQAVLAASSLPPLELCADTEALRAAVPLPDDPTERAAIEDLRAEIERLRVRQYMLGDAAANLERLQPLIDEVRRTTYPPLHYAALSLRSDLEDTLGDRSAAEASIMAALDAASSAHDDRSVGIALVKLVALVGVGQRRFAEARIAGRIAEATLERANSPSEDRAGLFSALGLVARLDGRYAEAKSLHRRALALLDETEHASKAERAAERSNFAATLVMMGEYAEARALLEQALAMLHEELGPTHPIVGYVHMNLGFGHAESGDYGAARREYEAAIAIWERAYGPDHVMIADALDNLSATALNEGRLVDARKHSERSIDIFTRTVGPEHPELADAILNFAGVLHKEGHPSQAAAQYERALAIHEKSLGPDHADLAYDLTGLGECRLDEGRVDAAIPLLERALALRETSEADPKLAEKTRAALARARAAKR